MKLIAPSTGTFVSSIIFLIPEGLMFTVPRDWTEKEDSNRSRHQREFKLFN